MHTIEKRDQGQDVQRVQQAPQKKLSSSDRAVMEILRAKSMAKAMREALEKTHVGIGDDRRMRIQEIHGRFFVEDGMRSPEGVEIGIDLAIEGDVPVRQKTVGIVIHVGVPVHDCRGDESFEIVHRVQFSWLKNREEIVVRFHNKEDMRRALEKIRELTTRGEGLMFFHKGKVLPMIELPQPVSFEQWRAAIYSVRSLAKLGAGLVLPLGLLSRLGIAGRVVDAAHMEEIRGAVQETQNALEKVMHMGVGSLNPLITAADMVTDAVAAGLFGAILMVVMGKTSYKIRQVLESRKKKRNKASEDI